ncbi:MAG: TPM domain-containing protein [Corynebacterium sp.]|nr:TPM domain-containing protein [Corynebacterium sp.]
MNKRARIGQLLCAGLTAGMLWGISATPLLAIANAAETSSETIQAQGTSTAITEKVTDRSGVLSESQRTELENKILSLQQDKQRLLYVVFVPSFGGKTAEAFAKNIVDSRGSNTAAFVVATDERLAGIYTGSNWPSRLREDMFNNAYDHLANDDWAGAANTAVDTALGTASGSSSSSSSNGNGVWLGGGAAALANTGVAIWAYSRRRTKKERTELVSSARSIDPSDRSRLASLPLDVLDELAHEELVSTDESIRRGKEELDIATAEFGPERTRAFTRAMNNSTTTLSKAFLLRQRLDDSIPESEDERRSMLVEIISTCGQADKALDAQAAEFAEMRSLLVNASSKLDELTQKTVDLRSRLPQAQQTLAKLQQDYSGEMLTSITDNAHLAAASLDEAEKAIAQGRELESRPAGQQGGMVAAIRSAEHASEVTDRLLAGIEHARENIDTAISSLPALETEVEEEIAEAHQLKQQGMQQGTPADWNKLDEVVSLAGSALRASRESGQGDPLTHYTALTDVDSQLDEQLDKVREQTSTHARQLQQFSKQTTAAASQIEAAEDLISSRGRIVGAGARTALADAKHLYAQALHTRDKDLRSAIELARQASNAAKAASQKANRDYNNYRNQQARMHSSNAAGNIATGVILGQILGGGGGFGGGFGGGGFSGGGGGGGGGFTGGAF